MPIGISIRGCLLLDRSLSAVAVNPEAIQILAYPSTADCVEQIPNFLANKIRSSLVAPRKGEWGKFAKVYKSGNRRYLCRAFRLDRDDRANSRSLTLLLLERSARTRQR